MRPRVLISDELPLETIERLEAGGCNVAFMPQLGKSNCIQDHIANYDGLVIRSASKVTAGVLARAAKLCIIGRAGIGIDNVDVAAATKQGVVVMNTPNGNSVSTAEHTVAMMMALARNIPDANTATRSGRWEKSRFTGVEIRDKVLGIIGCGNIGGIVAELAGALKMRVIAFDPLLSAQRAAELGVERVALVDLLKRADFITLHTQLTDENSLSYL